MTVWFSGNVGALTIETLLFAGSNPGTDIFWCTSFNNSNKNTIVWYRSCNSKWVLINNCILKHVCLSLSKDMAYISKVIIPVKFWHPRIYNNKIYKRCIETEDVQYKKNMTFIIEMIMKQRLNDSITIVIY